MAFRFRRTATPRIPEAEAEIIDVSSSPPSTLLEVAHSETDGYASTTVSRVQASYFTVKNWGARHDNEDRPIIWRDALEDQSMQFHLVGVLDGHDTAEASDIVSRQLPGVLSAKLKEDGYPVQQVCESAMVDLEEVLRRTSRHQSAGTCVLSCVIANRFVWCSNLGDCRAAIVSLQTASLDQQTSRKPGQGPKALRLTWLSHDHKASMSYEVKRIQEAGGFVCDGRVEGLEPSRTLGDFDVKMHVKPGVISTVPEVSRHTIGDGNSFAQELLVCATDGVWDVLSGQDICNIIAARKSLLQVQAAALAEVSGEMELGVVTESLNEHLKDLAEDFVQFSIAKGSRDDCTAVVALITVGPQR
eukprot:TRINITY_DN57438_c0_g1_i1.p1 TRINITY_DN57438_c0_g1~~TRINITY_DN57438_c0_g1_i1.p1  ORF type:complete len:359 (-),score=65.02 TRINITY_DN57438_c0_g1_i1:420-1496(-)